MLNAIWRRKKTPPKKQEQERVLRESSKVVRGARSLNLGGLTSALPATRRKAFSLGESSHALCASRVTKKLPSKKSYQNESSNSFLDVLSFRRIELKKTMEKLVKRQLKLTIQSDIFRCVIDIFSQSFPEKRSFQKLSEEEFARFETEYNDLIKKLADTHVRRILDAKYHAIDADDESLLQKLRVERDKLLVEFEDPQRLLCLRAEREDLVCVSVRAETNLRLLLSSAKVVSYEDKGEDEEEQIDLWRKVSAQQQAMYEEYCAKYIEGHEALLGKISGLNERIAYTLSQRNKKKQKSLEETVRQVDSALNFEAFEFQVLRSLYSGVSELEDAMKAALQELEQVDIGIFECKDDLNTNKRDMDEASGKKLRKSSIGKNLLETCWARFETTGLFPGDLVGDNEWLLIVNAASRLSDNHLFLLSMLHVLLFDIIPKRQIPTEVVRLLRLSINAFFSLRKKLHSAAEPDKKVFQGCDGEIDQQIFLCFTRFFPYSAGLHNMIFYYLLKPLFWANKFCFDYPLLKNSLEFFSTEVDQEPDQRWARVLLNFLDIIFPYTQFTREQKKGLSDGGKGSFENTKYELSRLCERFCTQRKKPVELFEGSGAESEEENDDVVVMGLGASS